MFSDEASYRVNGEIHGLNVRIWMSESQYAVLFSPVVTFRRSICGVD